MKISAIDALPVRLPFRFSFGHSLASRSFSENLVVRVRLTNGTVGYGEGIPRHYVTGEEIDGASSVVESEYAPRFLHLDVSDRQAVLAALDGSFEELNLRCKARGASWCALELAVIDAVARAHGISVADWLGPARAAGLYYGAVVPFCGPKALTAILSFYRLYGFRTVKLKVGRELDQDLKRLQLARTILGRGVTLRVDANCAWSADQTLEAAERMRPLGVVSIEQPLPAHDLDGLARVTASIPEEVVVDESLCTLAEAENLIAARACTAFNIRISKVGGIIASRRMAQLARQAGLAVHLGAQVGESGILSAAARVLGLIEEPMANYEGSDNAFLLKKDLTRQELTVGWQGYGRLLPGIGFGFNVREDRLAELSRRPEISYQASIAGTPSAGERE